jgi:hypothetical protein
VVRVSDRGQLVLVAAAVAALALVPVVAAYLQFGYAPAMAAVDADHGERITRSLDRLGDDAAEAATGANWSDREAAVQRLRDSLAPRLRTLEQSRLGDGVVVNVSYSDSLARQVTCPAGDGRAFGDCEVIDGVVVQERAGETVVVGVAFEVRVTSEKGTTEFGHVVRPR